MLRATTTRPGTPRVGRWIALLAASIALTACAVPGDTPQAREGWLDLSRWDFDHAGDVALLGTWEICWGEGVAPGEVCRSGWRSVPVRGIWSERHVGSPFGGRGRATYRLRVALPPNAPPLAVLAGGPLTAYRLWIDGEARGGLGEVGSSAETTRAEVWNRVYPIPEPGEELALQVDVANFEFRGGGLRRLWFLGRPESIQHGMGRAVLREATLFGVGWLVGLAYLAFFVLDPAERARGYFGLMAIVVGLRMVPASISTFGELLAPWARWGFLVRGEYVGLAIGLFFAVGYVQTKIPGIMPRRSMRLLQLVALALAAIVSFAPMPIVLATLPAQWLLPVVLIVLTIVCYGRAYLRGRKDAGLTAATALVYLGFVFHDIARTARSDLGLTIELFPYAVSLWLLLEAWQLLQRFHRTFERTESLSEQLGEANFELQETESAIVRFVPFDFLSALGKTSIRDVEAGDHARLEMTVLRCALGLPESNSAAPGDALPDFTRIQALAARLEPCVHRRGGFLDGFRDGAFEAFFPDGPERAVEAALEMLERAGRIADPLRLTIAIDTGPVLLGTIGSDEHLVRSMVGAPIDGARAIESIGRERGAPILVSATTRRAVEARGGMSRGYRFVSLEEETSATQAAGDGLSRVEAS